jgi:hypothetical protein
MKEHTAQAQRSAEFAEKNIKREFCERYSLAKLPNKNLRKLSASLRLRGVLFLL